MRTSLLFLLTACGADDPGSAPTSRATTTSEQDVPSGTGSTPGPTGPLTLRVATFNTALSRDGDGSLLDALRQGSDAGALVAEVLQQVRPDVVLLQEVDFEDAGVLLDVLHDDYLAVSQAGLEPLSYPHRVHLPSNTGVPSGVDLDGNGSIGGAGDAHGFGNHEGQYAFAVLSRFPLDTAHTWQLLRWIDMPDHRMPTDYYDAEAQEVLRLSSKTHAVVPVQIADRTLSLVVSHPTPPVFDGPEDRNGLRNHDEIALVEAILGDASWLVDDDGAAGGVPSDQPFVVLGDLNADPYDGDSLRGGISSLLDHARVLPSTARGERVPGSEAGAAFDPDPRHRGDPAHDTTTWGLRVDYTLPSADLTVSGSGVHWPLEAGAEQVSDHRLVWVDLTL